MTQQPSSQPSQLPSGSAKASTEHAALFSRLPSVCAALVVFVGCLLLFDARGLYFWSLKLPVTEETKKLRTFTEDHWRAMAQLGLEEPKHSLESFFLDLQDAHPLLYPRKYPEYAAKRKNRQDRLAAEGGKARTGGDRLKMTDTRQLPGYKPRKTRRPGDSEPRVLVVGDSIMVSVGPIIRKDVESRLGGHSDVIARVSTGLARPDVFDWRRELEFALTEDIYDYVVVMMGTNDSQDFVEDGVIHTYGTSEWVKAYNRRVAAMMKTACRSARRTLWVGLPPMKSDAFNRKIIRINNWVKRQAARTSCVEYVSLDNVIGDEQGAYAAYLKIGDHLEKIRNVDGIHVTARGGELISQALIARIKGELSLAH